MQDLFDIWKDVANRKLLYGVATVETSGTPFFQLQCMLNRTVGNNCSADNRTASHRTIHEKYNAHRTATYDSQKIKTAPNRPV